MLLLLFVRRWLLAYFMFARGMKVGWSNSNGMVESVSRREQDLLGRWIRLPTETNFPTSTEGSDTDHNNPDHTRNDVFSHSIASQKKNPPAQQP